MNPFFKMGLLVGAVAIASILAVQTDIAPLFLVEQATEQSEIVYPRIDYVLLDDKTATSISAYQGEVVSIKVHVTNAGTVSGHHLGIYVSFPELDGYDDEKYVDLVALETSGGATLDYTKHAPNDPDDLIWYECNGGYLDPAQYLMVTGYLPSEWQPGEETLMEIKVRTPSPGTFQVETKVSVADARTGGAYYHDPTSGTHTDQQCQPVFHRTIEAVALPNNACLPEIADRYPSIPVRGVRMQALSCSSESKCIERIDCLQSAGVTTLYYAVYYQEAFFDSDLLPSRSFDSLAYLIPNAHARGMRVYALIPVSLIGWGQHPEWNARLNYSQVDDDWLDYAVPKARSFVADVAQEIVSQYDVDGVLMDYIRWKSEWYSRAPLSADDVSLTVEGVYNRVKRIREIPVTASVFRNEYSGELAGQMWYEWLSESYIDYVTPMAYVSDSELRTHLDEWNESGHFPERIIPRLSVAWFDPVRAKPVAAILEQIQISYDAGATGMALWDDRHICSNPELIAALGHEGW